MPGVMTDLRNQFIARIAAIGPLTLAEFITDCLLHPKYGYYTTRTPFGRAGDFITAVDGENVLVTSNLSPRMRVVADGAAILNQIR